MASGLGTLQPQTDFAEIARRMIEPEQCALLAIDIQEKLLPPIFERERLLKNSQLLIRLAGILKIPVILTTQYARGLGATVPDIASLLPDSPPIDKTMFSCFGSDAFCSTLKRMPGNRTTVLLCGMESHICVTQTEIAALDRGQAGVGCSAGRLSRAHRVGRGQFPYRMELENRFRENARCRCSHFVNGNDDVRIAARLFGSGFQRALAISEGLSAAAVFHCGTIFSTEPL